MKLSKLLEHNIEDKSKIIDQTYRILSNLKCKATIHSHSLYNYKKILKFYTAAELFIHLIDNNIPFIVNYYGVSKIVKNSNEIFYSFYWINNELIIDCYKKSRSSKDNYNYIYEDINVIEHIKLKNLLNDL